MAQCQHLFKHPQTGTFPSKESVLFFVFQVCNSTRPKPVVVFLQITYQLILLALKFGTDSPTSAMAFVYADIEWIQFFDEQAVDKILRTNALKWCFK
ncbi:hypothetical protein [Heyndrickxia shackletonii]|nr:hypothetical protein [Heyndrickxia shackletonii]